MRDLPIQRIIIPFFPSVIKVAIYIQHGYEHGLESENHCMDNVCSLQDTLVNVLKRISCPLNNMLSAAEHFADKH